MDEKLSRKEKRKSIMHKFLMLSVFAVVLLGMGQVSAYNWDAMQNMSDFIDDIVEFFPKIITLIIYGIIIGVVIFVGAWIKKVIGKGTG